MYYSDKIESLKEILSASNIILEDDQVVVDGKTYPIIDDVIILLDPLQYPPIVRNRLRHKELGNSSAIKDFKEDIQFTFGEEWKSFPKVLPEHKQEFMQYFDLIDLSNLKKSRVCDLGCGIGRWSYFLRDKCRELVLVDFSEAIFVARQNLRNSVNAIFFMGDLKRLPFKNDFADFLFCLGVLHHLPTPALDEVRNLRKYSPILLIYLYYAIDNRAFHFRILLVLATIIRKIASMVRNPLFRKSFTWTAAFFFYMPFIWIGKILKPIGLSRYVPLYEGYNGKGIERIAQDVYDRFFTAIEQRFTKKQIMGLKDVFSKVAVSESLPYWHFVCKR